MVHLRSPRQDLHDHGPESPRRRGTGSGIGPVGVPRGGPHTVYEGDWSPYRLVLLEFPSREAFEGFYRSPAYQDLHALRDEVSYARMVGVEGLPSPGAAAAVTLPPAPGNG